MTPWAFHEEHQISVSYNSWTTLSGTLPVFHRRLFKEKLIKSAEELTGKEYEL